MSTVINGYEADSEAVAAIVASLFDDEDHADPSRLYARATSLLATYTDVLDEIRQIRAWAVAEINADINSFSKTGALLGLSKARVQQFVEAARFTGRTSDPA
ncbi:hypothetical protein [Saccharopolyspora shandongensis]|uniref:hypothetical protein n=1 Tax=Saccharopolyspora shandongensis TaxID=418495 RepID=UPI0033F29A03